MLKGSLRDYLSPGQVDHIYIVGIGGGAKATLPCTQRLKEFLMKQLFS